MQTSNGRTWATRVKFGASALVGIGAVGVLADLVSGLPMTTGGGSWLGWLLGIIGLGTVYLSGELVADWIGNRDTVTDPLLKRTLHLMLVLGVVVVFCAATAWLLL